MKKDFPGEALRVLKEKKEKKPGRRVDPGAIIREVCKSFSLEEEEFPVSGRDHGLSRSRGMAAWRVMEGAGGLDGM